MTTTDGRVAALRSVAEHLAQNRTLPRFAVARVGTIDVIVELPGPSGVRDERALRDAVTLLAPDDLAVVASAGDVTVEVFHAPDGTTEQMPVDSRQAAAIAAGFTAASRVPLVEAARRLRQAGARLFVNAAGAVGSTTAEEPCWCGSARPSRACVH